jgi:hypothetical protein
MHVFHHSVRSTFCNSHRINRGGTTKAFIFFLSFSFCYILMMFPYLKPSNLATYWTDVCTSRLSVGKFYTFSFLIQFHFRKQNKTATSWGHYQTPWYNGCHSRFLTGRMQFSSHLTAIFLALHWDFEGGACKFLRNIGKFLPHYAVSHHRPHYSLTVTADEHVKSHTDFISEIYFAHKFCPLQLFPISRHAIFSYSLIYSKYWITTNTQYGPGVDSVSNRN